MIIKVKNIVKKSKIISSRKIEKVLNISKNAVLPMLEILEKKGLIQKYDCKKSCSSICKNCKIEKTQYYLWIGDS